MGKYAAELNATTAEGPPISGHDLAEGRGSSVRHAVALQVISTDSAYTALFEGAIPQPPDSNGDEALSWSTIATLEDGDIAVVTISLGAMYRFKRTKGDVLCLAVS